MAQAAMAKAAPAIVPLPASEAGDRVVGLAEALAALGPAQDDVAVLEGNLAAAAAAHALNASRNLPTLSGTAGYSLTDGFNDATQARSAGAAGLGIGQSLSGGLTFAQGSGSGSTGGTRLGLTVTHNLPATPQTTTVGAKATTTDVPQTTSVAFSLSQAVWDGYLGGQAKATVDKSLLTLQGRQLAANQARSAARAKVKQAYVTTLVAQRTLALRLGILERQKALLAQIQATYAIRMASAIDLATARINERSAELDVETSRHDFALARQRLANILGLPPDSDFRVAEIDTPPLPAASLDEALAKGLASRTDIAQLELSKRSSGIDAALAIGASQPSLTATGGVSASFNWGTTGTNAQTAANGQAVTLGLRLALPILDAGAAGAQADAAGAAIAVAGTQAAQLRKTAAADIRDAWWNSSILAERIDLARMGLDLANEQLALVRQQLSFGTATNQDLLTASVSAANAEAAWLKSKSDQLLAELALETAMGL
jgi:outer membrane protein TolC